MVKGCCVHGCTANRVRDSDRKFYIIPKDATRRDRWLRAINRAHINKDGTIDASKLWNPTSQHNYVCSAHFVSGEKKNDPCHVDYVPSIFPQNNNAIIRLSKSATKIDRCKRAIKRFTAEPVDDIPSKKGRKKRQSDELQNLNPQTFTDQLRDLLDIGTESVCLETDSSTEVSETTNTEQTLNGPLETISIIFVPPNITTNVETPECKLHYIEINNLRRERDDALERVLNLEKLLTATTSLTSASVEGNDSACQMMTGITWTVFLCLFTFLSRFVKPCGSAQIPLREQFFLTLLKLRHNLTFEVLANLKGLPKSTIIDFFWSWVNLMYAKIGFLIKWTDRKSIFKMVPPVFQKKFPRLTSIIDCFEVFVESPKDLSACAYKKHTTIKFFISCNPVGAINFLSKAWGGRASDDQIVRESGFISPKYHLPGDQILADRGFTLHDDFAASCSAELITPSFTEGKKPLSAPEDELSRSVSSVRVHVERVIGLMKNRYSILKGTLPVRCTQSLKDDSMNVTVSSCDKIVTVCAALTNLGPSIVFKE